METLGERLKKLRKALDLTQSEFASKIGSVQNSITGYESGRRNPSAPVISLICKEFNVNEEWLRDGIGEMFKAAPSTALDALAEEYNYSRQDYVVVETFSNLSRSERNAIIKFIMKVAAGSYDVSDDAPSALGSSADIDIDAAVESYRRTLELQKKVAEESSALNTANKNEENEKGA